MPVANIERSGAALLEREQPSELKCLFYKKDNCTPKSISHTICKKCHRNQVVTLENAVPRLFEKIISMANMLFKVMGRPN